MYVGVSSAHVHQTCNMQSLLFDRPQVGAKVGRYIEQNNNAMHNLQL